MPQRPKDTLSLDFFDQPENWLTQPYECFSALLKKNNYSLGTRTVYLSMWKKFTKFLERNQVSLDRCNKRQFDIFIQSNTLTPLHQRRYAHVTRIVWTHLNLIGLKVSNPGYEYLGIARETQKGHNTRFIEASTILRIEEVLRGLYGQRPPEKEQIKTEWVKVRDAVIIGLMIGGGLTLQQAMKLPVNCAIKGDRLVLPPMGKKWQREVPLYPIAQEALAIWPAWYAAAGHNGPAWFPPHEEFRRLPKPVTGKRQRRPPAYASPVPVYRGIQAILEDAGLPKGTGISAQALRNAYATRLIADHHEDTEVAAAMGLHLTVSATRIRQAWTKYLETNH